jgi:hypothetical protein
VTRWRLWISVVAGLLAVALAVMSLGFRYEHKSWLWWQPPAVLQLMGRDYQRGSLSSESLIEAEGPTVPGSGIVWRRVDQEWPMRWTIDIPSSASGKPPGVSRV